jgi:hypothetical protein
VVQEIEHLSTKCEALNSHPGTKKRKKRETEEMLVKRGKNPSYLLGDQPASLMVLYSFPLPLIQALTYAFWFCPDWFFPRTLFSSAPASSTLGMTRHA